MKVSPGAVGFSESDLKECGLGNFQRMDSEGRGHVSKEAWSAYIRGRHEEKGRLGMAVAHSWLRKILQKWEAWG